MANAEAFTNLLRVLHEVKGKPDLGFDMETWTNRPADAEPRKCGYSACAVGWAAQDEWFHKHGMGFIEHWNGQLQLVRYPGGELDDFDIGWDAVKSMFDITTSEASHLFEASCYRLDEDDDNYSDPITIDEVIERVEDFVSYEYSIPPND